MDRIIQRVLLGLSLTLGAIGRIAMAHAAPESAPAAAADVVSGVWQHHKVTVSYFGITSQYSCDALEAHVKNILVHLGAREDAKVNANGCPRGQDVPSHTAWIETDFYTLAPADVASAATGTVKAYWATRAVTPHQPYFMGDGDCELIEQMKDLISKNFSLRDVQYQTECVPHEIVVNGFSIKGQALLPVATGKKAQFVSS